MVHRLDAVEVGLSGDVAVLDVDLHPLVRGLLHLLLQYLAAQDLPVLWADCGDPLEPLVLEQALKSNRLDVSPDVRDSLVGVLEPRAVLRPHGNVTYGGEAASGGPTWKPLGVPAPELQIHQTAVPDVVVVRRGQGLDDACLYPLSAAALFAYAEGGDDSPRRSLAGVPAAGVHRRIDRAFAVWLSLHVEHPARLGRNHALVPFYPAQRALLPEARDGAVNQSRVEFRQVVIRQSPAGHVSGTEGLYQYIGLAGELDGVLSPFLGFEVQYDAFLPPVPRNPGGMETERVSARRLDLDHVGAIVGHHQGAESPRHSQREVQDG